MLYSHFRGEQQKDKQTNKDGINEQASNFSFGSLIVYLTKHQIKILDAQVSSQAGCHSKQTNKQINVVQLDLNVERSGLQSRGE